MRERTERTERTEIADAQARRRAAIVAIVLVVIGLAVVATQPPIRQPQDYHDFADHRALLGAANGGDVLSNLGFAIAGLAGLFACVRRSFAARPQYLVFFVGITLTAAGSAYYHLAPDDPRLVWDRLPMTLGFMGLLAAVVGERIDPRRGHQLLAPLLVLGVASVLYWFAVDDLRPYVAVQFGSLLVIVSLLVLGQRQPADGHPRLLWAGLAWYVLAKLGEALDRPIFAATGELVSGHTLKHLAAAVGVGLIARMIARRAADARTQ